MTFGICTGINSPLSSPFETVWSASLQRELSDAWVASLEYNGIHSNNLLIPVAPGGSAYYRYTNIDPQYYSLGADLLKPVPNPFFGRSKNFNIQETLPLHQLLAPMPHFTSAGPAYLTNGRLNSTFLTFKLQTRQYEGLMLDASYTFRRTETNGGTRDMRRMRQFFGRSLHNPQDLDEWYGLALHESPHTFLFSYVYNLPFGNGRRFLSSPDSTGAKILDGIIGGWALAGSVDVLDPRDAASGSDGKRRGQRSQRRGALVRQRGLQELEPVGFERARDPRGLHGAESARGLQQRRLHEDSGLHVRQPALHLFGRAQSRPVRYRRHDHEGLLRDRRRLLQPAS